MQGESRDKQNRKQRTWAADYSCTLNNGGREGQQGALQSPIAEHCSKQATIYQK